MNGVSTIRTQRDSHSHLRPVMAAHTCGPKTQDAEAGGWQILDQPGLLTETVSKVGGLRMLLSSRAPA